MRRAGWAALLILDVPRALAYGVLVLKVPPLAALRYVAGSSWAMWRYGR